jgi:hypothetical protein
MTPPFGWGFLNQSKVFTITADKFDELNSINIDLVKAEINGLMHIAIRIWLCNLTGMVRNQNLAFSERKRHGTEGESHE